MALTVNEIQHQARYIRDILCPLVANDGGAALTRPVFAHLIKFIAKLEKTNITIELLRQTRIDKAFLEMCAVGSRWPASLTGRAERMLRRWGNQVGQLGGLRAALWAEGGRMAGCHKCIVVEETPVKDQGFEMDADGRKMKKIWVVDKVTRLKPDHYGSVDMRIGSWWIKPACAYRDGMLTDPNSDIAVGPYGAYAVVLAHGVETLMVGGTSIWRCTKEDLKHHLADSGLLNLMRNMHNHMEVRIIRSWKLRSPLAPKGGFRYDGLYSVVGVGIKTVGNSSYFTFELKRALHQADLDLALNHPTADEYDDWIDYLKIQEERRAVEKAKVEEVTLLQVINEMDGSQDRPVDRHGRVIAKEDEDDCVADDEGRDSSSSGQGGLWSSDESNSGKVSNWSDGR
ncbi:MAG: hypothetical protein M1823_001079 [Watsoniomyces obsoletus]|nr:MAG: hypothetical protein M1823_001079 [Watsoniomyces obsoletus]